MPSDDRDMRLIRIRGQRAMRDRLVADVNQLTISGEVQCPPELQDDDEDESVWRLVLTHTIDHEASGHWEIQHYHVSIPEPLGQAFVAGYRRGQKVIVSGRLDSPAISTDGRITGRAWIIATNITVLDGRDE